MADKHSPLRLAFIGGSVHSAVGYAHYVAARMDNLWTVEAGCFSSDRQRNDETAKRYGVPAERAYGTWQKLLAADKDKVDAVLVLTPTPSHREIVEACLSRGLAVICEKALASTSAEIEGLIAARDEAKAFLAVTYNYSGYPMVREMRARIEKGAIGKLTHFHAEMPQDGFVKRDSRGNAPSPQMWRRQDGSVPMLHLDLAVHLHQLVHYVTGGAKPLEAVAEAGTFGKVPGVVDNVSALARYSDGIQGTFWFSKSSPGSRNGLRLRFFGTEGSLVWAQSEPERLLLAHANGRVEWLERGTGLPVADLPRYNRFKAGHPSGFLEAFSNLYADLADALTQFRKSGTWKSNEVFGGELALEGLRLLEAMTASAKDGKWSSAEGERQAPRLVKRAGGSR